MVVLKWKSSLAYAKWTMFMIYRISFSWWFKCWCWAYFVGIFIEETLCRSLYNLNLVLKMSSNKYLKEFSNWLFCFRSFRSALKLQLPTVYLLSVENPCARTEKRIRKTFFGTYEPIEIILPYISLMLVVFH